MDELRRIQGKRLKEIRKILGHTQESFTHWLTEHGLTGNYSEPYKAKTVAAWESGRRAIPEDVKMALSKHVKIDGHPVQYAYLNGDSDFITRSYGAIARMSSNILDSFSREVWKKASIQDLVDMANSPVNKFALILWEELLPIYNINQGDIFDMSRFCNRMYDEIGNLINRYIEEENQGK